MEVEFGVVENDAGVRISRAGMEVNDLLNLFQVAIRDDWLSCVRINGPLPFVGVSLIVTTGNKEGATTVMEIETGGLRIESEHDVSFGRRESGLQERSSSKRFFDSFRSPRGGEHLLEIEFSSGGGQDIRDRMLVDDVPILGFCHHEQTYRSLGIGIEIP